MHKTQSAIHVSSLAYENIVWYKIERTPVCAYVCVCKIKFK